jgi:hypothetical protein
MVGSAPRTGVSSGEAFRFGNSEPTSEGFRSRSSSKGKGRSSGTGKASSSLDIAGGEGSASGGGEGMNLGEVGELAREESEPGEE